MRLEEWLRATGTSASGLREAAGMSEWAMHAVRNGLRAPAPQEVEAIAEVTQGEVGPEDWPEVPVRSTEEDRRERRLAPLGIWQVFRPDGTAIPESAALTPEGAWQRAGFAPNPYLARQPVRGHSIRWVAPADITPQAIHDRTRRRP